MQSIFNIATQIVTPNGCVSIRTFLWHFQRHRTHYIIPPMQSAYWGHYLLHQQINTDLLLEAKCRKPKGMDQLMKNEVIQNSRWLLEEFLWSKRDTRVTPSGHDTAPTLAQKLMYPAAGLDQVSLAHGAA